MDNHTRHRLRVIRNHLEELDEFALSLRGSEPVIPSDGDRLYVEGRIEYSQTEGEGGTKYWTDIVVNEMVMLGSTGAGGGGGYSDPGFSGGGGGGAGGGQSMTEPDDDLPF